MRRISLTLTLFLVFFIHVKAQPPHAWINYAQPYFRIPVAQNGIYRLSYAALRDAGFPVDACDPTKIQLYHRGNEQAIFLQGESDGQFNPDDFIEFYGRKNDGTRDAALYKPSSAQPHQHINLYSDTTSYFLTIGSGDGKRMPATEEENVNGLPPEEFHLDRNLQILATQYAKGFSLNDEFFTSTFDAGEGWTGAPITQGNNATYTLSGLTLGVPAAGTPQLEMMLTGRTNTQHQVEIYVGASFRLLTSANFMGFTTHKVIQPITWSDITADGKLPVRVAVVNAGTANRVSVSYVQVIYPQQTDAGHAVEKFLTLAENRDGKSYVEIKNYAAGSRLFDITEPDAVSRIGATAGVTLNAIVPFTNRPRNLLLTNVVRTPRIVKATFRTIYPASHNYIIITHPLLRKPAMGYDDPVKAYATYRASTAGGGYDTLVVNIRQLYDQFNYGETSPLAVFEFMRFLSEQHTPSYLFLIGKGLEVTYGYYRNAASAGWEHKDLVPPAGYPGSDLLYTAGLNKTTYESAVPTGRLTATKPEHVAAYLNKIKETEALPYHDLWRKKVLHLSGGIEDGEPEAFKGYLEELAPIAEGPYFGGQVSAIAKRSRDVQVINIAEEVNKGVGLITFLGHSSPTTLDFDVGFVTNPVMGYDNRGKYPLLLMNGCEAGAFFLRKTLFGEDWIHADQRGASGFIAHSSYALLSTLRQYTYYFYNVAYADSVFINKGIGDIQKETVRRYMDNASSFITNLSQVQQMVLLGDPAVKLFGASKPDLEVKDTNLTIASFNDDAVTVWSDSFALKLVVRNFGLAKPVPFKVEVERILNDNTRLTYDSIFTVPRHADTLTFIIRKGRENGFGNNTLKVTLDRDGIVDELNEDNNTATLNFFVPLNGTQNLYPREFAITNSLTVDLSFQATDVRVGERAFILELDTTNTFDSPYKKEFRLMGNVLARQRVELLDRDTLAYYWRTRLAEPLQDESTGWQTSSFTCIKGGAEGWGQVHFPQFLSDPSTGLVKDSGIRKIKFEESVTPVDVITFGSRAGKPREATSVKISGAEFNLYAQEGGAFGCRNNTINLIAFDRRSTVPYAGLYFKWYEILYDYGGRRLICGREPFVINSFTWNEVSTGNQDDLLQYVDNVAEGDSVLLYTIGNAGIELWPAEAKVKLNELGISVDQLDALVPGEPVVILGRKGSAAGTAKVFRTSDIPPDEGHLTVRQTIQGGYAAGSLTSTLIGPAQHWDSFIWNVKEVEPGDLITCDVMGVTLEGESVTLMKDVARNQDLGGIDATRYPYLRVVLNTADEVFLTTAQLDKWFVLFTPVAEGLLIPETSVQEVKLMEGETWHSHYRYTNISDKIFSEDSLAVRFTVFNSQKYTSRSEHFKIEAPAPGDTTHFAVSFSTLDYAGRNDVEVFVNPRVLPEQYYENNVLPLNHYLHVLPDDRNPVIDVTVDGRYLLNGDYVSPQPAILIKVWDGNPFILKKDTTGIRVFLTYPCDEPTCLPEPIDLGSDQVQWSPASEHTPFNIVFNPEALEDGVYTLRVEAADVQGNPSGAEPYQVSFRVDHESVLKFTTPHPNPFKSIVYYGFTISGSVVPDAVRFIVYDITGRPVFEEFRADGFTIGRNLFSWYGTDLRQHTLPDGIYLYEMTVSVGTKTVREQGKIILSR